MQHDLIELNEAELQDVEGGMMVVRFLLELAATYALEGIAGAGPDAGGYQLSDLNAP